MAPLLLLVHDVGMVVIVGQGAGLVPGIQNAMMMVMRNWGIWMSRMHATRDGATNFAVSRSWSGGTMMSEPGTTVWPFSHSSGSAWSSSVCWGLPL